MKSHPMATPTLRGLRSVRWTRPALVVVAIAVLLSSATVAFGFDPLDADIKYDWLVTREALRSGGDAYRDVLEMAHDEGVSVAVHAGAGVETLTGHPRPPGTIVLQLPLVAVPYDLLFATSVLVATLALGVVVFLVDRRRNPRSALISAGALLLTAPLWVNYRYAGQAAVVAALALAGWSALRDRDRALGGVLIGLASVLKLFPAFLIIPLLLTKRWKASLALVGTGLILNLMGLGLPGVSAGRALPELASATATWVGVPANGSLVRPLIAMGLPAAVAQVAALSLVALLVGVLVWQRKAVARRAAMLPFPWLAIGLLVIPLSWNSYDLAIAPALSLMATSANRRSHLLGLFGLGLWLAPVLVWPNGVTLYGPLSMFVRVLVVVMSFHALHDFSDWSMRSVQPRLEVEATVVPRAG